MLKSDFTAEIHLHNKTDHRRGPASDWTCINSGPGSVLDLNQTGPGSVLDLDQFWFLLDPLLVSFSTCGPGPRGVTSSSLTLLERVVMAYCSTFTKPLNYRNHLRPGSTQNTNLEQTRGSWFSLCITIRTFQKFFIAETTTYL